MVGLIEEAQETEGVEEDEGGKEDERGEEDDGGEENEEIENVRNKQVLRKQAHRREKMKERYNAIHQVHAFKVGDIVTVAIPAKDRSVNDASRIEAQIVSIPYENRFQLRTEYGILTNHYPTSELNPVPVELLKLLVQKLAGSGPRTLTLTLHAAAAPRSTSAQLPVKCDCKSKCQFKRCNCFKNKVKCTQYCHSGHGTCDNLPDTIAEQTEMSLIPRMKRKRQMTPSFKGKNKKPMVDQTKPSPRLRGLQSSINIFLPTRSRSIAVSDGDDGVGEGRVRDGEVGDDDEVGDGEVGDGRVRDGEHSG